MATPGEISKFQKWQPETVHRSALKNAPYNPRIMSAKSRVKLKKNLATVGLLEPPIWNRRSGNIVGGHQRVSVLDSLHKTSDYTLTVAAVDLSDKEEKEQNIFLNNGEAQGEWDLEKMEAMFKDGISVDATGFDHASVVRLFGINPGDDSRSADEMESVAAAIDAAKKIRSELSSKKSDPFSDDTHYYLVLVGGCDAQRELATELLGLEDNRYQDLRLIGRMVGLATSLGASEELIREWIAGEHDELCEKSLLDPISASERAKERIGDIKETEAAF